jgi:hypothetical protein
MLPLDVREICFVSGPLALVKARQLDVYSAARLLLRRRTDIDRLNAFAHQSVIERFKI